MGIALTGNSGPSGWETRPRSEFSVSLMRFVVFIEALV